MFFLRSPDRNFFEYEPNFMYSPSNGLLHDIENIDENNLRFVYYLNLLTNHTQYIPIDSVVLNTKQYLGTNVHAYSVKSDKNSNVETILYNPTYNFTYKITQRTGIIARRILNYCEPNKLYKTGDKLGFIIFGSRVDIDIPIKNIDKILVNIGDNINNITKIVKLKS